MADRIEMMLSDLANQYADMTPSTAFTRLYTDEKQFGIAFASIHERLNGHFESINDRARSTRHYWADPSREMIALLDELDSTLDLLKAAGFSVAFSPEYRTVIDRCKPWLSMSGGSAVPEDFEIIKLIRFDSVFVRSEVHSRLAKRQLTVSLKMVGEGSYAIVYSFVDPDYGIRFAIKRAKKDLSESDLRRFKREFEVLKELRFPYIVDVYRYDDDRNECKMEYCDETLRTYIAKRNGKLSPAWRKRIALQFLYGINYIHYKEYLHRDISLQNVLVKVYGDAALVKLSDFGLVKDRTSNFTRTRTGMRGTILDPLLSSFKDYAVTNEIYSIGHVLSYIFTGRDGIKASGDEVGKIIQKCVANDLDQRYRRVKDIIADVERLTVSPTDTTA